MDFSYSVVIRTLGNSGDKYRRLLESVKMQTVQPEEVIVAIPEGYEPDCTLGCERIVRCEKGMVSQRALGILAAKSEYILVCDDDVEFGSSFCRELYDWTVANGLDCCLPMEGPDNGDATRIVLGLPLMTRIRGAITGQVFTSRRKSRYLDVMTATAGHRIYVNSNRIDRCYYAQCGNFQCFFARTEIARKVHFEDELWLQQGTVTQYAAYDDPTFYYKMHLQGGVIGYCLKCRYRHLDAAAGRRTRTKLDDKTVRYYSVARNRTVFWYRFMWKPATGFLRKSAVLFGGMYGIVNYTIYNLIINILPGNWPALRAMFRGYRDAVEYCR